MVQVTDPRLLETTGGIVQGMSGSPILQDGKLVGGGDPCPGQRSYPGIRHSGGKYGLPRCVWEEQAQVS